MDTYKYIVIGGGMAGDSAVEGIREVDTQGTILLISAESDPPYNRPPLTKKLWKEAPIDSIWRHTEQKNVEMILATTVAKVDPQNAVVTTSTGHAYGYEQLLLATGGNVRKLPFGGDIVHYYRTLDDFRKVKKISNQNKRAAIIGSGFIGSELAAALAADNNHVTLIDMGIGIGWNIFPRDLVNYLNAYYRAKNVEIMTDFKVKGINKDGAGVSVENEDGKSFTYDFAVAGVGITPNTTLADSIGLQVDNGILVNEYLQTSNDHIYAAGDVANYYNPLLGERIRLEHSDNAKAMGKVAGRNMAGSKEPYEYLPFFYSDLFDLGYEAIGKLDSRLEIVPDWQEKFVKGVLYYIDDERVRGVLLWNVWDKLDQARIVIGGKGPVDRKKLAGRIK